VLWLEFRGVQRKALLCRLFASGSRKRQKRQPSELRIAAELLFQDRTIDGGAQQCNKAMIHGRLSLHIYEYRTETSYGIATPDVNYGDRFL
jgi:hypothetical protein